MTLLTLVQDVSTMIGLPRPTAVVTSADTRVLELLSFANSIGDKVSHEYEWQELTKEAQWSATGSIDQGSLTGSIATDFGYFIDQTFWDRSLRQPILGPATNQEWQSDRSWAVVGPPYKFIVQSGQLKIGPTALTAGDDLVFNYITKNWVRGADGTPKPQFTADTDETVIPQELFKLELVWRWKASKGVAYAEDLQTAETAIMTYTGQSGGRKILYLGGQSVYYFAENIPNGNWPATP